MRKINNYELKEIQLRILKKVAEYCNENDIKYFLGYGTLLGAVRHRGYIPWDDDIDIIMPRRDYERFVRSHISDDYKIVTHDKKSNYPVKFAKVSYRDSRIIENIDPKYDIGGINIDIIPLDEFPNSKNKLNIIYQNIKLRRLLLAIKVMPISLERKFYKNLILRIFKMVLSPFSSQDIIKGIHKKAMHYQNFQSNTLMGCIVDPYNINEIMDKSIFDKRKELEFEGVKFYAPARYDEYLTNIYGNYMKLPSKEEREETHILEVFIK